MVHKLSHLQNAYTTGVHFIISRSMTDLLVKLYYTAITVLLFSLSYLPARGFQFHSEAWIASDCEPVAFLHKTHLVTPRFLESAKQAKEEVERCGGYYRILLVIQDRKEATLRNPVLNELKKALGEDAVVPIGPAQFEATYGPHWKTLLSLFRHRKIRWNNSDGPELVWFFLFSDNLPAHINNIWVAEYDVAWTGDLRHILSSFPRGADLVCSTDGLGLRAERNWSNLKKRNWLNHDEVYMCYIFFVRYSRRLLRTILTEAGNGHLQYCEMAAPSICMQHQLWCKVYVYTQKHSIIGRDEQGNSMCTFERSIEEDTWRNVTARVLDGGRGHLYHALKW